MKLRDYQSQAIAQFCKLLESLKAARTAELDFEQFQKDRGGRSPPSDFAARAWSELLQAGCLPSSSGYVDRRDGLGRVVPNVCLKIPTGGGKTLVALHAMERLFLDYLGAQSGLLLWIVPSEAIFTQTFRHLANREHPYRQIMERLSGGRVKLLKKGDAFTRADAERNLCVLMLMLQSAGRQSTESLRLFRDTGSFSSFFPSIDDGDANRAQIAAVPNLDVYDEKPREGDLGLPPLLIHSLGNVLRLLRPAVVIDEGHRAYSELAKKTIANLNPSFVLELTATPNANGVHSNVLVDVPGTALKREGMIKLPIILSAEPGGWKRALAAAHRKRKDLEESSGKLRASSGRYIRPILLVRVERTGKDKRDGTHVHAEDVRQFLEKNLGVNALQIRVKSASVDELGDDDLLAEDCAVRYVITKDALREGWDCPFAYVLCVLSRTTASMALTQMIGRVLRQPYAVRTSIQDLDRAYVFCADQEVGQAVEGIKSGLENEGMADVADSVHVTGGRGTGSVSVEIRRRRQWRATRIFLPRVVHRSAKKQFRLIDYEKDVLGAVDWSSIMPPEMPTHLVPDASYGARRVLDVVDEKSGPMVTSKSIGYRQTSPRVIDVVALTRQLSDLIPNAWDAAQLVADTVKNATTRFGPERTAAACQHIVELLRVSTSKQITDRCEEVFLAKLRRGDIRCDLETVNDRKLHWALADAIEIQVAPGDKILRNAADEDLERSIFARLYQKDFNELERKIALYVDGSEVVEWWHRLVARSYDEYFLQGWRRDRVYPDFLIAAETTKGQGTTLYVIETKGAHLVGNEDTLYKEKLFKALTASSGRVVSVGQLTSRSSQGHVVVYQMVMQDNWRSGLARVVGAA